MNNYPADPEDARDYRRQWRSLRDMGNGMNIRMRDNDVPSRLNGRHWGGFRTAYKLRRQAPPDDRQRFRVRRFAPPRNDEIIELVIPESPKGRDPESRLRNRRRPDSK